jgi:hypothetical protein
LPLSCPTSPLLSESHSHTPFHSRIVKMAFVPPKTFTAYAFTEQNGKLQKVRSVWYATKQDVDIWEQVSVAQGEGRCPVRADRTTRPIVLADASRVPRMSSMRPRLFTMTWIAWTRPVRIACIARGAHCRDVT